MDKSQDKLAFIARVTDEFRGTLSAAAAIDRLNGLTDEVVRIEAAFAVAPPENPYTKWRAFPVDIVSYFSVGYVTCLEWHARARLTDLLTYRPGAIREDDLKKDVGAKTLVQLIGAAASIPQFIAATRNISSGDAYLGTFNRLFEALGVNNDAKKLVHLISVSGVAHAETGVAALERLFDYRNMLVHEINQTQIGHPFFHDPWDFAEARAHGDFVLAIMRSIEAVISASAPDDFPGKLLADGSIGDVNATLASEIARIEVDLESRIEGFGAALAASKAAIEAENEMLFHAHELHSRWLDLKSRPRRALLRARLSYLKALRDALE